MIYRVVIKSIHNHPKTSRPFKGTFSCSYQNCGGHRTPSPASDGPSMLGRLHHRLVDGSGRFRMPEHNWKKAQGARTTEFVAPTEPMLCSIASVVLPTKYIQKVYCNKKSAATEFDEDWDRPSTPMDMPCYGCFKSKIQQTKILVNGQRFGGLFYFGLM